MNAAAPFPDSAPEPVSSSPKTGRNLPLAIATGVLLAGAFVGSLYWHPLALLTLIAVLVVVALLELDSAFAEHGVRPATVVAIASGAVAIYGGYFAGAVAQTLAVLLLLVGAIGWAVVTARDRVTATVSVTLLVGVWVPVCASFAALLVARPDGLWYVMATVALAVSADIGAYGTGVAFGRHKMAPRISPGKTWEGAIGGSLTVLLLAGFVTAGLPGFDLVTALVLGVAVTVAATLGDLTESLVKRDLGVKDLGRILPGHGGIMDRVDSIIFALPAAHFVLLAVGV